MATYVMGDVHGEYDKFMSLLEQIGLQDEDTLYLMGDVLDRGPHPIKLLLKLMEMPNAFCLLGNHEQMALECLPFLMQEITEESARAFGEEEMKIVGDLILKAIFDFDISRGEILSTVDELCTKFPLYQGL